MRSVCVTLIFKKEEKRGWNTNHYEVVKAFSSKKFLNYKEDREILEKIKPFMDSWVSKKT